VKKLAQGNGLQTARFMENGKTEVAMTAINE